MKKLVAGLMIGLVLGVSSTAAIAASTVYWKRGGGSYSCEGTYTGVICKETNYQPAYSVAIVRGNIIAAYRGRVIFGCDRGYSPGGNCDYYGP
jgi:hypothetical protein